MAHTCKAPPFRRRMQYLARRHRRHPQTNSLNVLNETSEVKSWLDRLEQCLERWFLARRRAVKDVLCHIRIRWRVAIGPITS
jgi:hypothetical protein